MASHACGSQKNTKHTAPNRVSRGKRGAQTIATCDWPGAVFDNDRHITSAYVIQGIHLFGNPPRFSTSNRGKRPAIWRMLVWQQETAQMARRGAGLTPTRSSRLQ